MAVLSYRVWQAGAGILTLAFIAHFLTPIEQGFYYTFASLAAIQSILDMGLSIILVQVSAHHFSGMKWGPLGQVEGENVETFTALIFRSLQWYGSAGLVFLLAYPFGVNFLGGSTRDLGYGIHDPWLLLVVGTSFSFILQPLLSIIEGSGKVVECYAVRLMQAVCGAIAIWVTLAMGGGLYAVAMMPIMGVLVITLWLLFRQSNLLIQVVRANRTRFAWTEEVWPMQWRIGISWICGYLVVQIHTPLLFKAQSPVAAGQMGLTLTVANMLGLLAMSWMTSQTPELAKVVSQQNWNSLDTKFFRAFSLSNFAFAVGAAVFFALRMAIEFTPYGSRFLPPMQTFGLLLAILFSHIAGLFAVYLRAHRREPFMWPSVVAAALVVPCAIMVAPQWGSAGIVTVLLLVNGLFGLPVSIYLWLKLRKAWHAGG